MWYTHVYGIMATIFVLCCRYRVSLAPVCLRHNLDDSRHPLPLKWPAYLVLSSRSKRIRAVFSIHVQHERVFHLTEFIISALHPRREITRLNLASFDSISKLYREKRTKNLIKKKKGGLFEDWLGRNCDTRTHCEKSGQRCAILT